MQKLKALLLAGLLMGASVSQLEGKLFEGPGGQKRCLTGAVLSLGAIAKAAHGKHLSHLQLLCLGLGIVLIGDGMEEAYESCDVRSFNFYPIVQFVGYTALGVACGLAAIGSK